MPSPENIKIWIPACIAAYFGAGLVYYFCHFISNSYSAAGIIAIASGFLIFLYFSSQAKPSLVEIKNPEPSLVDLSPIRVLAEVKEALSSHYFGDKKWTVDAVAEEKGRISFSCRIKGKPNQVTREVKEHLVTLNVISRRMNATSSMELSYDIIGEQLNNEEAVSLCSDTTDYLEQRLQSLKERTSQIWI